MNNIEQNNKTILLQIGEKAIVEFIDITYEGLGVCKVNAIDVKGKLYENYPIFVEEALVKEKGIVEITKINKNFSEGKILKLFKETISQSRTIPICMHYNDCGGCDIMHMNYKGQLAFKTKIVKDAFERIALLREVNVLNTIGMQNPVSYRNKVQMPIANRFGKATVGFFKKNTHNVFPITKCYIQDEKSLEIANFIKNLLNEFKIQGYDEKFKANNKDGAIRHIVIKTSKFNNKIMIIIASTTSLLPHKDEIIKKIINRYNNISSIILNVNKLPLSCVLSEENIVLYGDSYIIEELCNLKFKIGASSFFQVNLAQTEVLYKKIIEIADFKEDEKVIDAYCGIGTISLVISKYVKKVLGIEIIKEAIDNAIDNANLNNIKNTKFIVGPAEELVEKNKDNYDTLVIDPPRKGVDQKLIDTILKTKFNKIIYVSCNPTTLARDIRLLKDIYDVKTIQPIDMFPYSHHVETIALLTIK